MCNNWHVEIFSEDSTGCENYLRTSSQRRVWPSGWSWLVLGPLQPARKGFNGKTAVFKENPPCCWPRHRWLAVQFPGALFIKIVTLTILLHKNMLFLLQNCSCWYCKWPRNKPVKSSVGVYYKDVPLLLVPLSNNGARRCPRKWQFSCMTREPWISWIENQGRWLCIFLFLLFWSVYSPQRPFSGQGRWWFRPCRCRWCRTPPWTPGSVSVRTGRRCLSRTSWPSSILWGAETGKTMRIWTRTNQLIWQWGDWKSIFVWS